MYLSLKCIIKITIFYTFVSLSYSDYPYKQYPQEPQPEGAIEDLSAPKPGWIDPFDMMGERGSRDSLIVQSDVEIHMLQQRCSNHEIYLRRFVNLFLHAVELRDAQVLGNSWNLIKLEFNIHGKDINTLKEFGQGGHNVPKIEVVSDVFNKIFSQKTPQDRIVFSFGNVIVWFQKATLKVISSPEWTVLSSVALMLFLSLWFIYKTDSYRLAIFTILLTIFLAGFGFNWIRMYEEKEVEKYVNVVMHGTVPRHCSSESQSMAWYEHMFYRMFGADCLEFYKVRDVRPIVKISPTDVLAETFSSMIIKPATHIGTAYGNFITSVLNNVPWWLKPVALPLCFVLPVLFLLILLAFIFNYRLSLSITGFHLIPSWDRSPQRAAGSGSQYVEDCSRRENTFNSILSDKNTPMFVMNWMGLKKLSTSSLLEEKIEKDKKEEPKESSKRKLKREDNQSLEEDSERMMKDLIDFEEFVEVMENEKMIEERIKRNTHTCAEGESSLVNRRGDLQSKPMIKDTDLSSGDRDRTSTTVGKDKDYKHKTT